jgi:hypothetical protein
MSNALRRPSAALAGNRRYSLRVLVAAIGLLGSLSQLAPAQDGTAVANGGPGWVTAADDKVRDRFRQLLLAERRDLAAGWQLATDIGRPVVPLLWDMVKAERADVGNRLRLLVAAMLAGGPLEDERLFAWLAQQKPMLEERTMAAMLLAMGPKRARPMPSFWPRLLGGSKEPQPILEIAARLAAVRFPDTTAGAPPVTVDDPGMLAAAAFAGLPLPPSMEARWWNLRATERHADLVWRGGLLGASREVPDGNRSRDLWLGRATEVMAMPGDAMVAARAVAVWLRAKEHDLRADGAPLPVPLLQVATGDLGTATLLQAWLGPMPHPRDSDAPHRLAVAYALSRRNDVVLAERDQWLADKRVAKYIAIALAWSLAGTVNATPIDVHVPELAEWDFVRAATGARVDGEAVCDDPQLQALLALCRDGRIARPALRIHLEEALWRAGCHPRWGPFELERALLRDLLLSGSNPGGKYQSSVRQDLRYSPGGMDRNDTFFAIAVAAFDFLSKPRSPMPPEHRLPD